MKPLILLAFSGLLGILPWQINSILIISFLSFLLLWLPIITDLKSSGRRVKTSLPTITSSTIPLFLSQFQTCWFMRAILPDRFNKAHLRRIPIPFINPVLVSVQIKLVHTKNNLQVLGLPKLFIGVLIAHSQAVHNLAAAGIVPVMGSGDVGIPSCLAWRMSAAAASEAIPWCQNSMRSP